MVVDLLVAASIVTGLVVAAAARHLPRVDRACLAAVPVAAVAAAGLLAGNQVEAQFRSWNDARLAPVIAWLHGVPLYQGLGEGPLLGLMYPPMAALAYLPAGLASSPEAAVHVGAILTSAYFVVPALVALGLAGRRAGATVHATAAAGIAFVLLSGCVASLAGPAFWIHADAPALGFAALACTAAATQSPGAPVRGVALASAAAVLAVLSKQVALPILAVVPAVAWLRGGTRAALRHAAGVACAGGVATCLLLLLVDVPAFVLNVIVVPSRHPWTGDARQALLAAAVDLLEQCSIPLLIALACLLTSRRRPAGRSDVRDAVRGLRHAPWTPWALAACAMIPTSLLGRVKMGGGLNALAFTVYFALIAALVLALEHGVARPHDRTQAPALATRAVLALALALPVVPVISKVRGAVRLAALLPASPERVGFSLASARPGFAYFPANPLVGLFAEGRAHHFSDGVYIRELAGFPVSRRQIDAHVPEGMAIVVFWGEKDYSHSYLPEFSEKVTLDGLPPTFTARARRP